MKSRQSTPRGLLKNPITKSANLSYNMRKELFYVAASRGRENLAVITSDRERLRETIGRSTSRQSASELARKQRPGLHQGISRGMEAARRLVEWAARQFRTIYRHEPIMSRKPIVKHESTPRHEPTMKYTPETKHKPVMKYEPVTRCEPAKKPEPFAKPEPVTKHEPAAKPKPVIRPVPVMSPELEM